jgi:hypothetical protein
MGQGLPQGTLVTAGQAVPQYPQAPQVMQLVSTINGPVFVPEQQLQQSPTKVGAEPPKLMIPAIQGSHPILVSPGHQVLSCAQFN